MSYDPVTTFAIYMIAILFLFTAIAAVADLWTAKVERDARRRARAIARAKRRKETEASVLPQPYSSSLPSEQP